jgi:hypothetical protein
MSRHKLVDFHRLVSPYDMPLKLRGHIINNVFYPNWWSPNSSVREELLEIPTRRNRFIDIITKRFFNATN